MKFKAGDVITAKEAKVRTFIVMMTRPGIYYLLLDHYKEISREYSASIIDDYFELVK